MERKLRDTGSFAKQTQGPCVKRAREERGWSQAELASRVGVSTRTVKRWEGNLAVPRPYASQKLCRVLGKTREELALGKVIKAFPEEKVFQTPSEPLVASVGTPPPAPVRRRCPSFVMLSRLLIAFLIGGGVGAFLKPETLALLQISSARTHVPISTPAQSNPAPYSLRGPILNLCTAPSNTFFGNLPIRFKTTIIMGACETYSSLRITSVSASIDTPPSNSGVRQRFPVSAP
jgi:transcriptional regulator with XRE-family HTH domain